MRVSLAVQDSAVGHSSPKASSPQSAITIGQRNDPEKARENWPGKILKSFPAPPVQSRDPPEAAG
ncbi:hypothetical protein IBA8401_45710 [Pseudomonas syringae]